MRGACGSAEAHGGGAGGEAGSGDAVASVDVGASEFFCSGGLELGEIFVGGDAIGLAEGFRGIESGHRACGGEG